jgi:hypothetical protein
MGKISELSVTKGKTIRVGDKEEWTRIEYSVKTAIEFDEEVQVAKAQIEGLLDGWLTGQAKSGPAAVPPAAKSAGILPAELLNFVNIEERPDATIIRPKDVLGRELFRKIISIVREHGGDYLSRGKDNHFRIPKRA